MRDWLSSLTANRVPELALALAAGYALVTLAETVVRIPVSALAQNVGRNPYEEGDTGLGLLDLFYAPYYLNFSVGPTVIAYGQVLSAVLALGLVSTIAGLVVRRRDRQLGVCPFCASRIPYESRHCAYCGSGLEPAES